ncbi:MAG: carbohydrate binding domain-containing protein, partial [Candidatus Chisholmbacteria bacterium]|nr:carbohydrate binding domain-containing protein [Candidatus Chisholmbacteria bacterium]
MGVNLPNFSVKRIKPVLAGAFFLGLVLGSSLPVGIVRAAAGLNPSGVINRVTPRPRPSFRPVKSQGGGLLVSQDRQSTQVIKLAIQNQLKSFLSGVDSVMAGMGRAMVGFFDGIGRSLAFLNKPRKEKLAQRKALPALPKDKGVVLGIEDDVADLTSRVALLEANQVGGDTGVSLGSLALQGENLIRNSSFEVSDSGDAPRLWRYQLDSSTGNTYKSAEAIRSGKYGLKFQGGSHGGLGISQPETKLEAGRSYVLSVYVKAVDVGGATLDLGFWDEVANAKATIKSFNYTGTKDWHRVSLVVDHPALSDQGKKWFPWIEVSNLGTGNLYIDDVQLNEGTVLSAYNSDLGDDAGQILGGGAVLVDNNGNVFPAKDGVGELGTSGAKFKALTLSKASIDKDGNMTVDGTSTLKGSVTLGDESSDTVTINGQIAGASTVTGGSTFNDDVKLSFGTGGPADILWETADANANELIVVFDEGGSVDVPVVVVGDASIDNVDLGFFNGVTDPSIAVVSDDAGDYGRMFVSDAGVFTLRSGTGDIILQADNDTGDYFQFSSDGTDLTLSGSDAAGITVSTDKGAAAGLVLVSTAGGIDISTGTGTAGNDIDVLAGASINLTAAENVADSIVLTSSAGGIDILATAAAAGEDIDITATGSSVNLQSTE